MSQSSSNDYYALARLALEARVRDRDDLLALLNDPAPTRAPAKPRTAEAKALALAS